MLDIHPHLEHFSPLSADKMGMNYA